MLIDQQKKSTHPTYTTQNHLYNSWIEINAAAFNHNIAQYKKIVGPVLLAPVIKSNAYGHGLELIAHLCENNPDVDRICVVSLSEALRLRAIGITKPLLVLSIIDANIAYAIEHDIEIIVYDIITAHELNALAHTQNKKAQIHIKVDTGLSRLGLSPDAAYALIQQIQQLSHITISGIFTHYAASENADQTFTNQQIKTFNQLLEKLDAQGIHIPLKHTSCSAAITANNATHFTMVRLGIGIYGLWPSADNKKTTLAHYPTFSLKPIMTWKTRIIHIKEISAGSYVGYNLTHQTNKPTRIATLPIGYWDGYDRRLSNKGIVLINNQCAPVVGIVAMNLIMVDVTGIDVLVGDTVTLLCAHEHVNATMLAQLCNTINYELVTRINPLAPRMMK